MTEIILSIVFGLSVAVAGVFGIRRTKEASRKEGHQQATDAATRETLKRVQDGQDSKRSNRVGTPDERVRRLDGRWD